MEAGIAAYVSTPGAETMPRGKQRQRVVDDEDDIEQGSGQKRGNVTAKKHPGQQSTAGQEHSGGHEDQAPQSDEDVEEDDEDEQRRQEEMASHFKRVNHAFLIDRDIFRPSLERAYRKLYRPATSVM